MAVKAAALGDFLRARRQQVRPEDVGLVAGARRRVAGLRREELAMRAGIRGSLRELAGTVLDDPRMKALIAELPSSRSRLPELRAHAKEGYRLGVWHLHHPLVGNLYLRWNQLIVPNVQHAVGQHVLTYRAEPGGDSARALEELRSLSAAPQPQGNPDG